MLQEKKTAYLSDNSPESRRQTDDTKQIQLNVQEMLLMTVCELSIRVHLCSNTLDA